MNFKDFKTKIQKKREKTTFKVRNSFGVYDIYKALRKQKWEGIGRPLTEHEFYSIIRRVNQCLADKLSMGDSIRLPHSMGDLELRKKQVGVSIVNNKLKNTYPINWEETVKLWYEDAEAKKAKTLLRKEVKESYFVKYNKHFAVYENQTFYQFTLNRFIRERLKENINQGKVDALW